MIKILILPLYLPLRVFVCTLNACGKQKKSCLYFYHLCAWSMVVMSSRQHPKLRFPLYQTTKPFYVFELHIINCILMHTSVCSHLTKSSNPSSNIIITLKWKLFLRKWLTNIPQSQISTASVKVYKEGNCTFWKYLTTLAAMSLVGFTNTQTIR